MAAGADTGQQSVTRLTLDASTKGVDGTGLMATGSDHRFGTVGVAVTFDALSGGDIAAPRDAIGVNSTGDQLTDTRHALLTGIAV